MDNVMELESIIGLREALNVQRVVLFAPAESKKDHKSFLINIYEISLGSIKYGVRGGRTWWPTTATQTIIFDGGGSFFCGIGPLGQCEFHGCVAAKKVGSSKRGEEKLKEKEKSSSRKWLSYPYVA